MSENIPLSDRELEVLRLVAEGASNNEIAQRLIISPNTVKVHIRNIYGKLGVLSRTEATMTAIKRGLIAVPGLAAPQQATALELAPASDGPTAPVARESAPAAQPEPQAEPADDAPLQVFVPDPELVAQIAPAAEAAPAPISADLEPARLTPIAADDKPTHIIISRKLIAGIVAALVVLAAVVVYLVFNTVQSPQATGTPGPLVAEVWKPLTALPQPTADGAAVFTDQSIYLVGGAGPAGVTGATRRLALATGVWEELPGKPNPVADIEAALIKGKLYVPGGIGRDGAPTALVDVFDLATKTWSSGPALPAPRAAYALAAFEGDLLVIGGRDANGPVSTTLILDPDAQRWSSGTPLPVALQDAAVAARRDEIYLMGGSSGDGQASLATFRYSLGQWQQAANLPESRVRAAAVAVTDHIYLVGGNDANPKILVYANNAWSEDRLDTGYPLSRHMLVSDERNVYALGGWNGTTSLAEVRQWQPSFQIFIPGLQRQP